MLVLPVFKNVGNYYSLANGLESRREINSRKFVTSREIRKVIINFSRTPAPFGFDFWTVVTKSMWHWHRDLYYTCIYLIRLANKVLNFLS